MGTACSSDGHNKSKKKHITKIVKKTLRSNSRDLKYSNTLTNYIAQKRWISRQKPFVCTEKFFANYKEYLRDQSFVSDIWNQANVDEDTISSRQTESQTFIPGFKLLVRTGIPLDKVSSIILEIFNKAQGYNDLEYECALNVAFPRKVPCEFKNVPLFSFSRNIEDVLPVHYLNKDGLGAFKRIMWVYEKNVPFLEFSPLLSQVVATLLLFLKENEVYCIVKEMLGQSERLISQYYNKNGEKSLKWHFTLTKLQFEASLESLSRFIKKRANGFAKIWKHFKKINYDCNDLFWRLIKTLFFEFLPLSMALRIFMAYMNEGIKVYYRFILALLQLLENDILQCNTPESVISLIKQRAMNLTRSSSQALSSTAYDLDLDSLKRKFSITNHRNFSLPEPQRVYFPELIHEPSIISTLHFETIWDWLPHDLKLSRPIQAFSSRSHGWSLGTLYARCAEKSSYKGILILIQTTDLAIFGAFIDGQMGVQNDSIGSHESFLFKLSAEEKKYASTKKNNIHMICGRDSISIGAGLDGSAIYLGNGLLSGSSYKSATYHNEPLHHTELKQDHQFECSTFELYWIV